MTEKRMRNWCSIVYPESAPENWVDILENEHVSCAISPLHDMDVDGDGLAKKAHFHVIITFSGKKSKDQVQSIFDKINAVNCQPVNDIRSYSRYLCHLDSYNKAQYNTGDVVCLGGFDYYQIISSNSDKYGSVREMIQFCKDNSIVSFADLLDYASVNRDDWFRSLCDNSAYVMKEYLKSAFWDAQRNKD